MDTRKSGNYVQCLLIFVLLFHCYECSCKMTKGKYFFGPGCSYLCHCVTEEQCNDVTGSCPSGCAKEWMGPGCQYRNIAQIGVARVSDAHDKQYAKNAVNDSLATCTDTGPDSRNNPPWWRVTFKIKSYITGVTFVVNGDYLDQVKNFKIIVADVPYEKARNKTYNPGGNVCHSHGGDRITDTKFDVMCDKPMFGNQVRIVLHNGTMRLVLCDFRIYGGRNLAIKKEVNSSQLDEGSLDNVVDGVFGEWKDGIILSPSVNEQLLEIDLGGTYTVWGYNISIHSMKKVRLHIRGSQKGTWEPLKGLNYTKGRKSGTFDPVNVTGLRITRQVKDITTLEKRLKIREVQIWGDCVPGTCGLNCSTPCHCQNWGAVSYIDRLGGTCKEGCRAGWTGDGQFCNKECQAGAYGRGCNKTCEEHHCASRSVCDKVSGKCPRGCKPGWRGSKCKIACSRGHYEPGCNKTCDKHHCANNSVCDKASGNCPSGCEPGWKGQQCNTECKAGTYGRGCNKTCDNDHCANKTACDKVTGECLSGCEPGWTGSQCNTGCSQGNYGKECNKTCDKHLCASGSVCDKVSGDCPRGCEPGWKGPQCNTECSPRTYGQGCNKTCDKHHCANKNVCDKVSGNCPSGCEPGWKGPQCNKECADGKYGAECSNPCPVGCRTDLPCRKTDGDCPSGCKAGWTGHHCAEVCPWGYYGQDCNSTCECPGHNSTCGHVDGQCDDVCSGGSTGSHCVESDQQASGTQLSAGGVVAIVLCLVLVLVAAVAVSIIVVRRKRRDRQGRARAKGNANVAVQREPSQDIEENIGLQNARVVNRNNHKRRHPNAAPNHHGANVGPVEAGMDESVYANITKETDNRSVAICNLGNYMESTPLDELYQLFQTLPRGLIYPTETAQLPANQPKNRYKGMYPCVQICLNEKRTMCPKDQTARMCRLILVHSIRKRHVFILNTQSELLCQFRKRKITSAAILAELRTLHDHCRVVMQSIPGEAQSDYINATYINGFDKKKAYIAAAAPIETSLDDFWRMIWERQIETVVMVTHLEEAGKVKCLKYWPDVNEQCSYRELTVTTQTEERFADFTVRSFTVVHESLRKQRRLNQYHFTAWPDKDVPDGCVGLAHFLQVVRGRDGERKSPLLVHCSAGVGRTGTFIALDILYNQGLETGYVSVYQCVAELRQYRVNMVQTKEQYRFIHEVLFELLALPSRAISLQEYETEYTQARRADPRTNTSTMELHFQELEATRNNVMWQNADANDPQVKETRLGKYKVVLATTKGEGRRALSDALYLPSYKSQKGFIVSSTPKGDDVQRFIRLIWRERIGVIVTVDHDNQPGVSTPLLTTNQRQQAYQIDVDSVLQDRHQDTVVYDIKQGGNTFRTRHVVYKDWPMNDAVPKSNKTLLDVLHLVEDYRTGCTGPVLVFSADGIGKSCFFCVVLSILERAKIDDEIAVTQTLRHFRSRYPNAISCFDQYACCHDVAQLYAQSNVTYANT